MTNLRSSRPAVANGEDNRQAFWTGMRQVAERGMSDPNSLSPEEVRALCQLMVLGMTRREDAKLVDRRSSSKS